MIKKIMLLLSIMILLSVSVFSDYTMFKMNSERTNWDGIEIENIGILEQTFNASSSIKNSPIVYNGYVYFGTEGGYVYQVNASNVSQVISSFFDSPFPITSEIIVDNGYVYFASYTGSIYQLDANNVSILIDSTAEYSEIECAMPVYQNKLYISAGAYLYVFNATDLSSTIGQVNLGSVGNTHMSPCINGDYIYVPKTTGLYQLNVSNVSQIINQFNGSGNAFRSSCVVDGEYVYVVNDDYVYQLDKNNISNEISSYHSPGTMYNYSSPAISDGYLYVGTNDSVLQLDANNISILINSYIGTEPFYSTPAIANGQVYIGSYDNNLYILDAENVSIVNYVDDVNYDIYSSPAVTSNYVYFASTEGILYQLNTSVLQDTTPPASITGLTNANYTNVTSDWYWTNPIDADFNHSEIYINGVFQTNTSDGYYNVTGLTPETEYTILIWTVDNTGNINNTNVTDTITTSASPIEESGTETSGYYSAITTLPDAGTGVGNFVTSLAVGMFPAFISIGSIGLIITVLGGIGVLVVYLVRTRMQNK